MSGRKQVPWASKLRRVHAGVARKAEWMAPDDVVDVVRDHYLEAMRWLQDSALHDWSQQWTKSPNFLDGLYLKRYQEVLKHYRIGKAP
ncbi:MAG: hypothetical protein SF029_11270, partial [bacterium]|nr:hypothetical protein [bacterium]